MDDSGAFKDDSIVDDSDGPELTEPEKKIKEQNERHYRKRKRLFYCMIRRQMEFYFGDANLSKDRFINKLLAVSECKYHDYFNILFYWGVKFDLIWRTFVCLHSFHSQIFHWIHS